jgi:hypothetical protein
MEFRSPGKNCRCVTHCIRILPGNRGTCHPRHQRVICQRLSLKQYSVRPGNARRIFSSSGSPTGKCHASRAWGVPRIITMTAIYRKTNHYGSARRRAHVPRDVESGHYVARTYVASFQREHRSPWYSPPRSSPLGQDAERPNRHSHGDRGNEEAVAQASRL